MTTTAIEAAALLAVFASLGTFIVPCHWTSIWADREFTGWVAPISNRIADGHRLYEDGLHSPMPPLPYVIFRLLFHGSAIWVSESAVNFACQMLTILLLWLCFSPRLPRPVPFWAALATIPVFVSLPKTIAYDAIAQLFVAATAMATLATLDATSIWTGWLPALCISTAAGLLSKQNTGVGAMAGVCLAMVLFPGNAPYRQRLARLGLYLIGTCVAALAFVISMTPFASPSGMLIDVFLTGAEAKGGTAQILGYFPRYATELWHELTAVRLAYIAAGAGLLTIALRTPSGPPSPPTKRVDALSVLICLAAAAIAIWCTYPFRSERQYLVPTLSPLLGHVPAHLLATGFVLSIAIAAVAWSRSLTSYWSTVGTVACVTIPPAILHCLSVPTLRWTYDNNPLIFLALTVVGLLAWEGTRRLPAPVAAAGLLLFAIGLQVAMWSTTAAIIDRISTCSQSWPEVSYLRGARLSANANGMREMVRRVRTLAPHTNDTVLLLPNDPNVEAWIDRPRPALSSAIVFTDQYWERYVAADFERLRSNPPAIIIIGPEPFWRWFSGAWNHGALDLTTRVEKELLPKLYEPAVHQPIVINGGPQTMAIYVRKAGELDTRSPLDRQMQQMLYPEIAPHDPQPR